MPETSIHKNGDSLIGKDYIWFSDNITYILFPAR